MNNKSYESFFYYLWCPTIRKLSCPCLYFPTWYTIYVSNYFKGSKENPYHLSVGAVVFNEENKICCHYFKRATLRKVFENFTDFYILMRETMEMGESIEQALHRGLMEEFGIIGDIITYLGSIKGSYPLGEVSIEKTTNTGIQKNSGNWFLP